MNQNILVAAEQLINEGFYLFPVGKDKKALKQDWENQATNDIRIIKDMLENRERKGIDPQIAIACGPSGLFVLDIDVKNGKNGYIPLEALEAQYGQLPVTVTVSTPNNGEQFYFRGIGKSTVDTLGEGLDTRGKGGYVVCPPSVLENGKEYTWVKGRTLGEIAIAEAPQWLIDLTARTFDTTPPKQNPVDSEQRLISAGERNDTLFREACRLRHAGVDSDAARMAISVMYLKRCEQEPPMDEKELAGIVASAYKYSSKQKKTGRPKKDSAVPLLEQYGIEACTDLGNARRLVRQYGADIRYTGTMEWLLWDGTRWNVDASGGIHLLAEETVRDIPQEATQVADETAQKAISYLLRDHAVASQHDARLNAMVKRARHQPEVVIEHATLDNKPWLLNVENGTINLQTGELGPHRREDYLTKVIPIRYNPEALCPNWLHFLTDIMCGDDEMVAFLQRSVGYTLTGLTTEQCLFILYGMGANGKSVFLTVLKHLLGAYAKTAEFKTFTETKNDNIRNDLARLMGARLVAGSEGDAGQYLSESVVKSLTGGDAIAARFLRKEFFEFVPLFKLFLATNHKPYIANQDEGIWRRIRLIPFEKSIPKEEQNPHLVEDVLLPELAGILSWSVQGCLAWQDTGLQPPVRVLEATEDYREEMDALAPFVEECFVRGDGYQTPSSTIQEAYVQWCQRNNIRRPLGPKNLISKLKDRGFKDYRTSTERGLCGLKPKLTALHKTGLNIDDLKARIN